MTTRHDWVTLLSSLTSFDILEFTVPGAPRPKGRPRFGKGRAFTPKSTREYERLVRAAADKACLASQWVADSSDVDIEVLVYRARKRGDLDNFIKACTDAMNGVVYEDDSQIASLWGCRLDTDRLHPRVEIKVVRKVE